MQSEMMTANEIYDALVEETEEQIRLKFPVWDSGVYEKLVIAIADLWTIRNPVVPFPPVTPETWMNPYFDELNRMREKEDELKTTYPKDDPDSYDRLVGAFAYEKMSQPNDDLSKQIQRLDIA
jgi:hypothetical protein